MFQIPEFFGLYGVKELPFFWEPFKSPLFTLIAIWFIPGLLIPGEKLTIITLLLGFLGSYAYVKYNNHNKHITLSSCSHISDGCHINGTIRILS